MTPASVLQISISPGGVPKRPIPDGVATPLAIGDTLAIIESMKMEIGVQAPCAGRVSSIRIKPGQTLAAGDLLALIDVG